jgi:histone H3/H4
MTNQNPFQFSAPVCLSIAELKAMRVDRADELLLCHHAIAMNRHNVLLYGERGVGKSFLVRLLQQEIEDRSPELFAASVNIAGLSEYGNRDELASFSRAVLLQLCRILWTDLIRGSYLDLRERLDETGREITLRGKPELTIQRVYSQLMFAQRQLRIQHLNSIGFSAGAKGERSEKATFDRQQSDILPFEFAEFAGELIAEVLEPRGKSRLILICDEANRLPLHKQEDLLERYLELFGSKQVQFLFVAGLAPWEKTRNLPLCFETRVELKGFSGMAHTQELIEKAAGTSVKFSAEAIRLLHRVFKGHQRYTLDACRHAYESATSAGRQEIDASLMKQVLTQLREQRRRDMRSDREDEDRSRRP